MKQTDEQRIESIKKILDKLNHPEHRDVGNKKDILVNRTKKYPNLTETERMFAISGKDTYESGQQWSCGTVAKTFCYLNSQLPKSEQLDLEIMISTHPDHFIDSMSNHTLPCVKMGDGKYYAIEPQKSIIPDRPRHPQFPDIPFIMDEIKVGNKIHHILKSIIEKGNRPYQIAAIMSWPEYEKNMSDFGNFLRTASIRDKQTKEIIAAIEIILKQINSKNKKGNTYTFCKAFGNSKVPVKIVSVKKSEDHPFDAITIKIKGNLYHFFPDHSYCLLHKVCPSGDTILSEHTPSEYVQEYEQHNTLTNMTNKERQ
ncbi:MAG: hypothetical protein MJ170_01370 [Alphaproteobacteria bacterium]|nr:hypothetical protein [Alphaproteobacteria bacterium]